MFLLYILLSTADSKVIITEVMSNVKGSESTCGRRNEFVEIHNQSSDTVDLTGFKIFDLDDKAIPDDIQAWDDPSLLIKYPGVKINSTVLDSHSYAIILDRDYTSDDTTGGNAQPYAFPDSVLVLTTDDHTICDGLTTTDPLLIFSTAAACTTTFGTPFDSADGFPYDPGDGISWERIDLTLPDSGFNWYPSIDSSGCTPGRENSTTNALDLALDPAWISISPAVLKVGEDANIKITVINEGLRSTNEYGLSIFDDQNHDSLLNANELIAQVPPEPVAAFDSVALFYVYEHPAQGEHLLAFRVDFPEDKNPGNNTAFKNLLVVGEIGELIVSPEIFTPNKDGLNDFVQIDYRLPESNGALTVSIFDSRGKRIHDLCRKTIATSDKGTLFWNGETARGKAPTGMYLVYLEYKYHSRLTKAKKTTVLAR